MLNGYTVFTTYLLKPTVVAGGYSPAIHCNYIQSVVLNTTIPQIEEIRFYFPEINDFKFLSTAISNGTGYTANYLYAIVQLVANSGFTTMASVKPDPNLWKIVDITAQIPGHVAGAPITPAQLSGPLSAVFKVSLSGYYTNPAVFVPYVLNNAITGLNYPTKYISDNGKLCFGDETFFLGNVTAEIHADVYTTNISILLNLGNYNSSTNTTWVSMTPKPSVFISEIGIYDDNGNLVAIGKLNDPVEKNGTISRTLLFALDF